ncbi:ribosome biogenesis GTP-binding protein YihA/YsxC [Pleionea litopenaei]|uniref:Probable GTP-binding protein EngB n=1 Tax=Pleionea litopenaei TaxID=3070815 RepID=A0AA51RR98_9GAMM|nr:ribosome biogenesis GTP-binding protein YihA/YsxC [Pleionea sp. HL-JVS1]WMS86166.1 ribosome biogenesis GTP-binding protein YihA/YsxC [Pleionea sp. HL-JVS1]
MNKGAGTEKKVNPFRQAQYIMGAAELVQLPADAGIEVAFAGRSNAGKSSALNVLCEQKSLARTSKTPGRTQLINLFKLDEQRRLVDLPGYGFAKVSIDIKERWQATLSQYLQQRNCLQGLVVLMDIRHPLKDVDCQMLEWAAVAKLPTHVLLSKADKLKQGAAKSTLLKVKQQLKTIDPAFSAQTFSSLKRTGFDQLMNHLLQWFEYEPPKAD